MTIMIDQVQKEINQFRKESRETLKGIFGNKIKQSFLISILEKVGNHVYRDVNKYFNFTITNKRIVMGDGSSIDYDICRTIVGIHRSNTIFMPDYDRAQLERNSQYREQLVQQVLIHLKLRPYSAEFFRKKQIKTGDEFLYFPLLYKLFAISTKSLEVLMNNCEGTGIYRFYVNIMDKSIAALSLIEDNFLDNAYPICRLIIELYIKLLVIELHPELLSEHEMFSSCDLNKTCCGIKYPEEFENKYLNRKNKKEKSRIDFLHYGWIDNLSDYHEIVTKNPYSINGLIEYIKIKIGNEINFDNLKRFYRMCHSYTHGNVGISKYSLLHYLELSLILGHIIPHVYELLLCHLNIDSKISDIDILSIAIDDYRTVFDQYQKRSTENFNLYYNIKNNN